MRRKFFDGAGNFICRPCLERAGHGYCFQYDSYLHFGIGTACYSRPSRRSLRAWVADWWFGGLLDQRESYTMLLREIFDFGWLLHFFYYPF